MSTPLWVTATRGASVGTAVIEADDETFTIAAHGLVDGQQVIIASPTGGAASVLVEDAPYYVAAATTNTFQLRPSPGAPIMTFATDGGCAVYLAGGLMDAQTIRDGLAGLIAPGNSTSRFVARAGVFTMGLEDSHVSTSGMTWTTADLIASVRHSTGRMYIVPHPTESGAVTAADPSNGRIDALDLQIQDDAIDSSGFARGRIIYTAGTPAVTPVAPAVPSNAERITTFTVAAAAGSTGTPTIPRLNVARGGIIPVTDSSQYPTSDARYKGSALWDISLGQLIINTNGFTGGWTPIASTASFQSVRRIATTTRTSNTSAFTAETLINSVTASLESGKTYRVRWLPDVASTVVDDMARFILREDNISGTIMQLINVDTPKAGADWPGVLEAEYTAVSTGNKTFAGTCQRASGSGNLTCNASATQPQLLYVEYIRG